MKPTVLLFWFAASPVLGNDLSCTLTDPACTADCAQTDVTFQIDPAQFVAPQDANDPPRRQVARVRMNARSFTAQAILMDGGVMGFHEDAGALGSVLMIVQSNGDARLTLQPENTTLAGTCAIQ